ncbi:MAG: hypothetical protein AAF589_03325 [Planctomycetota bacterium]
MENPPEHLAQLTSTPTAAEAAIIVGALNAVGVEAVSTGVMTTNKLIASGEWVQIMVAEPDLPVARNTLAKLKEENAEIDWSQVDVGEPTDGAE